MRRMIRGTKPPHGDRRREQKQDHNRQFPPEEDREAGWLADLARETGAVAAFCRWLSMAGDPRAGSRACVGNPHLREEAVAPPRNSLHKVRSLSRVAERLTDFADGFVETVVEIYESIRGPEFLLKFFPSHNFSGVLDQGHQELERLFLQANSQTVLAQLASAEVQFENPKAEPLTRVRFFLHVESNPGERECTTGMFGWPWKGTFPSKSSLDRRLPGDVDSSGKELGVH